MNDLNWVSDNNFTYQTDVSLKTSSVSIMTTTEIHGCAASLITLPWHLGFCCMSPRRNILSSTRWRQIWDTFPHISNPTHLFCFQLAQVWFWLLAFISGVGVLYIIDQIGYDTGEAEYPSLAASTIYNGLHRIAWTFTLGWVIFACFHGYGGRSMEGRFYVS